MTRPLLFEVEVERNHDGSWLSTNVNDHLIVTNGADDVAAIEAMVPLVEEELGHGAFHFLLVEMKTEDDGQ